MANGMQVTVYVEEKILAEIDAEAAYLVRSRNWVIGQWLESYLITELPMLRGHREDMALGHLKKIANVSDGGVAQDDKWIRNMAAAEDGSLVGVGGDPEALTPVGKAQDGIGLAKMLDRWKARDGEDWINKNRHALTDVDEVAGISQEAAKIFHSRGVPLSREILVRWGLAENYKPNLPADWGKIPEKMSPSIWDGFGPITEKDLEGFPEDTKFPDGTTLIEESRIGAQEIVEAGTGSKKRAATGKNRRSVETVAKSNDGAQSGAVGTGKSKVENAEKEDMSEVRESDAPDADGKTVLQEVRKGVDMAALRDICALKPIVLPPHVVEEFERIHADPAEVDLCGFKSYNDVDGEWYICGLEKHGPKVKHGDWMKV